MVGPISFSGPVSGIDYTSIINKMLELQRQPETTLKTQIQNATDKKNALLELNISLLALKQTTDALRRPSFFSVTKASSNNESVVGATSDAGATPGTYAFTVQQLAQSHQIISNGFADATTTPVATADGSISISQGGGAPVSIAIAAGSKLQDIATAINAAGVDVSAAVINDGSTGSPYRLTLTSRKSGLVGQMTIDASSVPALSFTSTTVAQDAVVLAGSTIGGGLPATLTSSTNTLSGAVPGLTLSLKGTSTTPVTVSVSRDTQAVVDQAQHFIDSYNAVIQKIKEFTSFDPTTFKTGVLFGDSTVSRVERDLGRLVVDPVAGIPSSQLNTLASVGIRVGDQGALTFDSAFFSGKLESSFDQVENLFTKARPLDVSTPLKDFSGGAGVTDAPGADLRILVRDGSPFDVDIAGAKTLGSLLLAINNAPGNGGRITAEIAPNGFSIRLIDTTGGSANPLEVQNIGSAVTASQLKIAKQAGPTDTVLTGDVLSLPGSPGIASRMSDRLDSFTGFGDGLIATQTGNLDRSISARNKSIDQIEKRVLQFQATLVRRFTALEQAIAKSQNTQQRLSQLLTSLSGQGK
jgi:flagellar hook-associated protein 2